MTTNRVHINARGRAVLVAALALGGSTPTTARAQDPLPQGSEPVTLDPADFTTRIDNPY